MQEFRTRMTENGRIIIPAACRRLLNLKPGEELILHVVDHELRLMSLKYALQKAKDIVKQKVKNKSLVSMLKKMRKVDVDNE